MSDVVPGMVARRALVIALALAAALTIETTAPAQALVRRGGLEARDRVARLVPTRGSLLGSWVKPRTGWDMEDQKFAIREFERTAGRQLDVNHFYYSFHKEFPTWREPWNVHCASTARRSSSASTCRSGSPTRRWTFLSPRRRCRG